MDILILLSLAALAFGATLSPQIIVDTGIVRSLASAASGGDEFVNSGRMFIAVVNAHGSDPRTITVNSQAACNQGSDHDIAVVITAAQDEKVFGPFPKDRFNDSDGKVQITYSDSAADLTIAIFELP
jgi:hypothetical protein